MKKWQEFGGVAGCAHFLPTECIGMPCIWKMLHLPQQILYCFSSSQATQATIKELEIHRAAGTRNLDPIAKVSRETFFSQWAILSGNTEEFLLQTPKYFVKTSMVFEIT
jgi:hypothetical protein